MNRKNCTEMMCYSYRVLNMALGRNPTRRPTPKAVRSRLEAERRAERRVVGVAHIIEVNF